jgi:hypothetical protein
MQQSNQDDSTIIHITMHTVTKKLPLFGHIINSVSFTCKINLHVIQENQTLAILPLFLHFCGYIFGIKFIDFNHVKLWLVNLYVHNISHHHVQFNVTIIMTHHMY